MIASILAVGAGPAAAQSSIPAADHKPNAGADWSACVGAAGTHDAMFSDVSEDSVHADDINCIAYYGVTLGIGDGTYAPGDNVSAFQMKLFVQRAADLMGADGKAVLGKVMLSDTVTRLEMAQLMFGLVEDIDAGVRINSRTNDIEYQDDNNEWHVVNDFFADAKAQVPIADSQTIGATYELGITRGTRGDGTLVSTPGSTFEPSAPVTRAQMASFIARTLDHSNLRPEGLSVQRNNGKETMVSLRDGDFMAVEDARIDMLSSAYPDDAFDEDDGECEPRFVTDETQSFSLCKIDRDDFLTDDDGNVELKLASDSAASAPATCSTGSEAALRFETTSGSAGRTVWAWTGSLGDEVDDDTELAMLEDVARPVGKAGPDYARITGGLPTGDELAKMGETVTFTLQLYSKAGTEPNADKDTAVGPDRSRNAYVLTIEKYYVKRVANTDSDAETNNGTASDAPTQADPVTFAEAPGDWDFATRASGGMAIGSTSAGARFNVPLDTVVFPNSDGELPITLTNIDTDAARNSPDVAVRFTLLPLPSANDLLAKNLLKDFEVDGNYVMETAASMGTGGVDVATGYVIFSDDPSDPHKVTSESADYRIITGNRTGNSVTVKVVDQYGDGMGNVRVSVESSLDADAPTGGTPDPDQVTYPEEVDDTVQPRENNADGQGSDSDTVGTFPTRRDGTYRIGYIYTGDDAKVESITPESTEIQGDNPATEAVETDFVTRAREEGDAEMVYWTKSGTETTSAAVPILVSDVANRTIVVDEADTPGSDPAVPMAYYYDEDDTFIVAGAGVTFGAFEAALAATIDDDMIRADKVKWSNYVVMRPGRLSKTVWELSLNCS